MCLSCRLTPSGAFRLLVVGGSQGARIMADIVPPAIEQLEPALCKRLVLTQQVRDEDTAGSVRSMIASKHQGRACAFLCRSPGASCRQSSGGVALRRGYHRRIGWLSAVPPFSCRCPARSIRISSPMPVCSPRPAVRSAFRRPTSHPLVSRGRSPAGRRSRAIDRLAAAARTVGRLDAAERLADLTAKPLE